MKELSSKIIGVLCGGISPEREVSLHSGKNVYDILKSGGYHVVLLDLKKREELKFLIQNHKIDLIFNTLHGYYGEDGRVQAALEELKIPYTGCDMESSNVSMNKVFTKLIAQSLGVPVASYLQIKKNTLIDKTQLKSHLPFVIKPESGGSSVETYLVESLKDLEQLIIQNKDLNFIIEELIEGTEVTVGVISNDQCVKALPILELKPSNHFYDYEAKYTEGKTKFIIPANISEKLTTQIKKYGILMHSVLGCQGASRSDFIIKNDVPYFLELNSSPGMTALSDVPAEAVQSGMSLLELCEFILRSAIDRF